jgi:hypothetical protein
MRKPLRRQFRRISKVRAGLGLVIILVIGAWQPANGGDGLQFFAATYDRLTSSQQPERYDSVIRSVGGRNREVYIERAPALAIPLSEIEAISAKREQRDRTFDERMAREAAKQNAQMAPDRAQENFDITFRFSALGAKTLGEYSRAHSRELFEVKFRGRSLGLVRLADPSRITHDREVTLMLAPKETLDQIRALYPQLTTK